MSDHLTFTPWPGGYFSDKGKLQLVTLLDDITKGLDLRVGYRAADSLATGVLYRWDPETTVWVPAEPVIQARLVIALGDEWSTHREKEALAGLLRRSPELTPPEPA